MRHSFLLLTTVSALSLVVSSAHAADVTNLGLLSGSSTHSSGYAVSDDGTTVVGVDNTAASGQAYRWTSGGGMTGLGYLATGTTSEARSISGNGNMIVGQSHNGVRTEAFRWTAGGGMIGLGQFPSGIYSSASDVNNDGTVIVGVGINSAFDFEAFRWTSGLGMEGLGDLAGGIFYSSAAAVSNDGTTIVGVSESTSGSEAFRWTSGGGIVGLSDLAGGGFASRADAVNADGSVIVGRGVSANGTEAFRWTSGLGMEGLGDLAGGTFSSMALGVNNDGTVIVGTSNGTNGNEAFRWTQAGGIISLSSLLTAGGANLTGWSLSDAQDVDSTGNIIVGTAVVSGVQSAYLANLNTMAVTTPVDLVTGLASAVIPVQQSQSSINAQLGQSLFAATQSIANLNAYLAPAAGDGEFSSRNWSGYIVGSFGAGMDNDFDNNEFNGTAGVLVELDRNLAIGLGVIGSHNRADRAYGGTSELDSKGGTMVAAYQNDAGLHLYGTAFVADLKIDSERHYLNGAGIDTSDGDVDGIGYGAAVRGGWEFAVTQDTNMMPYVEFQASRTELDAYTETSGGFPASFGDTTSDQLTGRLGTQISYIVTPSLSLGGRAAWAHRLKENDDGLTASTTGFTGTLGGESGDRNWAEGAVTANLQVTKDTRLGSELSGRSGKTQDPAVLLTFGLKTTF